MRTTLGWLCFLFCAASLSAAQTKKPSGALTALEAGKLCENHWHLEQAEGWLEGPVYILFHREKTKAPWTRNPSIKLPGLEATAPGSARSLVCVQESLVEMGQYDSGAKGYSPSWDVYFISLSDHKAYTLSKTFGGGEPPMMKYHAGAAIGPAPLDELVHWLRLAVGQRVARLKMQLALKEFYDVSATAFSEDGTKLAVAQEPTHYSTQSDAPAPVTVFDLVTRKPIASFTVDYTVTKMALSKAGDMVAVDRYGTPQVWDVASGKLAHKLPSLGFLAIESLEFGPNDELAVAGKGQAALWNVSSESQLWSAKGSRLLYSSSGAWLLGNSDSAGVTVTEMGTGAALSAFHFRNDQNTYAIARDGKAVLEYSGSDAFIFVSDSPATRSVSMKEGGSVLGFSAVASASNGFVVANDKGFVGIIWESSPEPRVFVATQDWIRSLALSSNGKLIAVGGHGSVSIWEPL